MERISKAKIFKLDFFFIKLLILSQHYINFPLIQMSPLDNSWLVYDSEQSFYPLLLFGINHHSLDWNEMLV